MGHNSFLKQNKGASGILTNSNNSHICIYCNSERNNPKENCVPCGALFTKTIVREHKAIIHAGEMLIPSNFEVVDLNTTGDYYKSLADFHQNQDD